MIEQITYCWKQQSALFNTIAVVWYICDQSYSLHANHIYYIPGYTMNDLPGLAVIVDHRQLASFVYGIERLEDVQT